MPFKKGASGNAKGRPPAEKSFKAALDKAIAKGPEQLRKAAESLLKLASAGEAWAIRELADRLDGKPAQAIEGGDPSKPVRHRIEMVIVDPQMPRS